MLRTLRRLNKEDKQSLEDKSKQSAHSLYYYHANEMFVRLVEVILLGELRPLTIIRDSSIH